MKKIHNLRNGKVNKCQICGEKNLNKILSLGVQPPCDSLLLKSQLRKKENKFPLNFMFCENCILGQVDYVVPKKKLFFSAYPYRSGITKTLVEKLYSTSDSIISKFGKAKGELCVDIGSNDGTLLKGFKRYGYSVLGVEATNIAKIAIEDGIETIQSFFNEQVALKIISKKKKASLITATNVFAHVPNLYSTMKGIDLLLNNDGIFVSESHYLMNLIDTLQYDSIYHEHLKYYSLNSLERLFNYYNFEVFDVEFIKNYGGSIRVFASRKGKFRKTKAVVECLNNELKFKKEFKVNFEKFKNKVENNRIELRSLIKNYKDKGRTVIGVGCPGRCSTILNYCKINTTMMDYIAEQKSSLKLNKFLPGMKIPVIDEKEMFDNPPDLAILLSWHYSKEIISILRKKGFKSKILIPLPNPRLC